MCRSDLFSDAAFIIPLLYPHEEGDVADWVRETTPSYEGDPNSDEWMEVLVQEIQRASCTLGRWPTAETADFMRGFLSEQSGIMQGHENGMAGILRQLELLAQDRGGYPNASDSVVLDEHPVRLPQAHETSRELHTTIQ